MELLQGRWGKVSYKGISSGTAIIHSAGGFCTNVAQEQQLHLVIVIKSASLLLFGGVAPDLRYISFLLFNFSSILAWSGSCSGPPSCRASQSFYLWRISEGSLSCHEWESTRAASTEVFKWLTCCLIGYQLMLLIGLIWSITTSLPFHNGMKTHNRLSSQETLFFSSFMHFPFSHMWGW